MNGELPGEFERQRQDFIKRIPPGTEVWDNESRLNYGTTVGEKRIYFEVNDYVQVKDVNGEVGRTALWLAEKVIKKDE
ncbi:hypothetical protein A3F58_01250 [Candidatus Roizmanbacteria bacterium RIFCSPHIGHO2_12_FULL_37_9b]|uniref:Uncharacterized protein n=1 Tax=Candidatus Roizmanbacteria bacterium RIFCSPLOWO2_02_FULL_43_10 TaxID=1802078 RepID=A0A1F7JX35_9BACT|nr:MAG: hypothetical protein A3F58_01250 [Candidatus Roizmanbacteria bacterium RIFCSPHIGHO2_12_FULL_37_9b]OGK60172.1 MAG: hypothetical protein A3I56_02620 [Candidatus Roizmanbacteria bacterium RIFCSPLOWO2_02_FULL_43_10]